jgi:heptosyltransferase-2
MRGHPLIDRLLTTTPDDLLQLAGLDFDLAFVVDKSLKAMGVLRQTRVHQIFGFGMLSKAGGIMPSNSASTELWSLGISNEKKFHVNQKSEVQLMMEAFELSAVEHIPEYNLPLTPLERQLADERSNKWRLEPHQPLIGLNTGCSPVMAAKKLTVSYQRQLIKALLDEGFSNLVLLGGPEDRERNEQIGEGFPVFQSPTDRGLRDGLVSVAACDLVVSGDSLGLHMGISQKKFMISWFGPTCAQEIELYGRGVKLKSPAPCSPCWKRSCDQTEMCYDQVRVKDFIEAIKQGQDVWSKREESLLSKPPF